MDDEELARRLQQEWNAENQLPNMVDSGQEIFADVFDPTDATSDDLAPFKDLATIFLAFNEQYFEGKLSSCEVKWSSRMTKCAGLCSFQRSAGFCSIRMSEPLLKYRPESDMIDTLLHEMIHAYLFLYPSPPIRSSNDIPQQHDRDGHGTDFQFHMERINRAAGTKITIYHSMHDEVNHYLTHIWKCDGPCRFKAPYFGTCKRSMNRPPQPADTWYADHQITCGGAWTKISEPEPKKKKSVSTSRKKTDEKRNDDAMEKKPVPTMLDKFLGVSGSKNNNAKVTDLDADGDGNPQPEKFVWTGKGNVLAGVSVTISKVDEASSSSTCTTPSSSGSRIVRTAEIEAAARAALARFERNNASTRPLTPPKRPLSTINISSLSEDEELTAGSPSKIVKTEPPSWLRSVPSQSVASIPISETVMVSCPVCSSMVKESDINEHLDSCIC